MNFVKFLRTLFLQNTSVGYFWTVFVCVQNLVETIRQHSSLFTWYYVPTSFDLSDISTGLMSLHETLDLGWFASSSFLLGSRLNWPCQKVGMFVGEVLQKTINEII